MEIEQYVEQFELEEEKLRALRERIRALREEEAELLAIVEGWRAILRGHGLKPPETQSKAHDLNDAPTESKSDFVYAFVVKRGDIGTSTRDLLMEARVRELKLHGSWPYTELLRLRRRGLLVKDGKKYYPNTVDRIAEAGR